MRIFAAALMLLFTVSINAQEITVDTVLAAHSLGAPVEKIIARINDPATTVAGVVGAAETGRLRAAGVPEEVISALVAKAAASPAKAAPVATTLEAAPAAVPALQPDNPNLTILVRAVKAGTSESLLADQIKSTGVLQRPSMNDVLYLKENKVSEAVIKALMEAPLLTQAGLALKAGGATPNTAEVEGLAYLGQDLILHLKIAGQAKPLVARLPAANPLTAHVARGAKVWCGWSSAHSLILSE